MKKSILIKIAIIAGVIILALAGILIPYFINKGKRNSDPKAVSVIIITDLAGSEVHSYPGIKTTKGTVGELLVELNESKSIGLIYTTSVYGMYIDGFFDKRADPANKEWYTFLINGESSPDGVSQAIVKDGDTYTFKLDLFQ